MADQNSDMGDWVPSIDDAPQWVPSIDDAPKQGVLSNRRGEGIETSIPKGAATAGIYGLGDLALGQVGNLGELYDYLGKRATGAVAYGAEKLGLFPEGKTAADFMKSSEELGRKFETPAEQKGLVNYVGGIPFPTGKGVAHPILSQTGEYAPEGGVGQAAMTGVRTATGMMGPGGLGRGVKAFEEGAGALPAATEWFKGGAEAAPAAAAIGTTADVATQVTGEPLAGVVTGMALPIAARAVTQPIRDYLAPGFKSNTDELAAQRITNLATNPEKVVADVAFQPRGVSEPTTGELTLDPGLLQAQNASGIASEKFRAKLSDIQNEQNKVRSAALETVSPTTGNPLAPTVFFKARRAQIENDANNQIRQLESDAQNAAANVPGTTPPEVSGATLRTRIGDLNDQAKTQVNRLYNAVDPDGSLNAIATPIKNAAQNVINGMEDLSRPMMGEERAIFHEASNLPDVKNFSSLTEFDKRITAEITQQRRAGDDVVAGRLDQLRNGVRDAINNAVDHQHAYELQNGTRTGQGTIGSRLQQEADAFLRSKQGGPAATPELVPNMTPEASANLQAAKDAHAARKTTYATGPVGEILRNNGFRDQYTLPASGIPAKAFPTGDRGYQAVQSFLNAAQNSPTAIAAMQDIATSRLRSAMGNATTLEPRVLETWKRDYAQSLRALDEVTPGFSNRFDNAATATQTLQDSRSNLSRAATSYQEGEAGSLIGANHPGEVSTVVGSLLSDGMGPTKIKNLISQAQNDPNVINGLRSAGVDYLLNNLTNSAKAGGERVVSGAKVGNFIAKNGEAFEALYGKEGMQNMRLLVADLERAQEAGALQRSKTGSDTAQNWADYLKEQAKGKTSEGIGAIIAYEMMDGLFHGDPKSALLAGGAGVAKGLLSAFRTRGIANINDAVHEGLLYPEVGRAMIQRGLSASERAQAANTQRLTNALLSNGQALEQEIDKTRPLTIHGPGNKQKATGGSVGRTARASGGKVSGDVQHLVDRLMNLAAQAKRSIDNHTKPLLDAPDASIVKALRVANEAI